VTEVGIVSLPRALLEHPARLLVTVFSVAILVGTAFLCLPAATRGSGGADPLTALFTATSATCVTGLVVEDTPTYWSGFGQGVILALIQVGGFGIMTMTSLLIIVVSRRIGLRQRLVAQAESGAVEIGDVRRILRGVAWFTIGFESVAAVVLAGRFALGYDEPLGRAVYLGVFHAVSSFNNAGFALFSDSLTDYGADPWIMVTVTLAFVFGGLGFPVLLEVRSRPREPRRWSVHTKLTLLTTGVLFVVGIGLITAFEWTNPGTLGPLDLGEKLARGAFSGMTPRTVGFHVLDYGAMTEPSLLVTIVLMFIGGGSASTAGGIKVTTFALLASVIYSELRGEPEVTLFRRRSSPRTQRRALTVALLAVAAVAVGAMVLILVTPDRLAEALFESASAFGTVGLSTGSTGDLPAPGRLVLVALMLMGRLGPWTLGAALVLRRRQKHYRYPEEGPIIG
jgi:potassium uptake TrkH family protein